MIEMSDLVSTNKIEPEKFTEQSESEVLYEQPVKRLCGVNKIIIWGPIRLVFGCKPWQLMVSFFMMNLPLTAFNVVIGDVRISS
jgi:hypothetical protein